MKRKLFFTSVIIFSMILFSGCGFLFSSSNEPDQRTVGQNGYQDNQNNGQSQSSTDLGNDNGINDDNNGNQNNNSSSGTGVSAKYQGKELGFRALTFEPYGHPALSSPGIRIHTKDRHAGSLESTMRYSWDREDLVEVQVGDKDLYGQMLKVIRIEIDGNLYRIVVRPDEKPLATREDKEIPARAFFYVDKGELDPNVAKFTVQTEDGKELQLQ